MTPSQIITIIGISTVIIYSITRIFSFYGISSSSYIVYIIFYIFILFCVTVFETEYYDNYK